MTYIYTYSLGSIVFLGITMHFYFSSTRIHNFEDKFTTYLMCSCMLALIFDLLASLGDQFSGLFPTWALYVFNFIGIAALHFCQPCFCLYLYKANDERKFIKKWAYHFTFLPFFILLILLVLSAFTQYGIFYIDELGLYRRGAFYNVVFFTSAIYYITAFVLVLVYYRNMEHSRNRLTLLCLALLLAAAALQYYFPRYLLNTSATALTISMLFLALHNPVDNINPLTGCFSRPQLSKLLLRYHEKHLPYTLVLFSVSISNDQHISGFSENTMRLLRLVSDFLKSFFPKDAVVYMDSTEFVVVSRRSVDLSALSHVPEDFASTFGASTHIIAPELSIAVLQSEVKASPDYMLITLDYLFRHMQRENQTGILVADEGFRRKCYENTMLAANIDELLTPERAKLFLVNNYSPSGSVSGVNAFLSVALDGVGDIAEENLLLKADELGRGWKYFSLLLEKLSEKMLSLGDGTFAEIAVPTSICLSNNAAESVDSLVRKVGLDPRRLVLSMKEENVVFSHMAVRENIFQTAELGYTLRVTDFASGITNVAFFISMPVDEIKLNVSVASSPLKDGDQRKMLKALIGLLKGLNKIVICNGVTDPSLAETLFGFGVDLIEYKA